MALLCRSAAIAAVRSAAVRSKTLLPTAAPSRRFALLSSRSIVSALGTVESLMPLHSAIASSRLKSSIGIDSTCWTCLSQVPLRRLKSVNKEDERCMSCITFVTKVC